MKVDFFFFISSNLSSFIFLCRCKPCRRVVNITSVGVYVRHVNKLETRVRGGGG